MPRLPSAALMDLALHNRIDTDLEKLMVVDRTPLGDDILDDVLSGLAGICDKRSELEIGEALYITEGTAKNHVSSVIEKLGLRDRTQAALWAVRHGL